LNLSPYELVLIAGGFTVIGALVGGWIGYINALNIYNITEFNKAATDFKNVFLYELIYLKYNARIPEGERTYTTLNEFLFAGYVHRHLKAYEIFRNHLSAEDRIGIDKAWQKYCKHPDDPNTLYFEKYITNNVSKEREKELMELALKNLESVLEFAKHK